eukprot:gene6752-9253_t
MKLIYIQLFISVFCSLNEAFRVLNPGEKTPEAAYFKPGDKGFVGVYGDPSNYKRERVNEGAYESESQEFLYEGVSPRQACPNMVGPFTDGSYYCTAREYGYCDRRSGTCFCNFGYEGIDCSSCAETHFLIGSLCYPKKLCTSNCNSAGTCNYYNGTCSCYQHRTGPECETLLCSAFSNLCETCTKTQCLKCSAGYYLTGKSDVCGSCYDFDPRCAGCTKEDGCTLCADSTLTSVLRSGYRSSDQPLPAEENIREFSITLPFGTKNPDSFADAENYVVVTTPDKPLRNSSVSCKQGLSNDDTWSCESTEESHIVCGHYGVFSFLYPNYTVSETDRFIQMVVQRTGGGFGNVTISYFVKHITTNDSDVSATTFYTTNQILSFEEGVVQKSFYLTILDDNIVEENEVFQVVLEIPEGGGSVAAQFRTNVTIIDDDISQISAKLTKMFENTTTAKAGVGFSVTINPVHTADGTLIQMGGNKFISIIENQPSLQGVPTALGDIIVLNTTFRQDCFVIDNGNGSYTIHSYDGIEQAGVYELKVWNAFSNGLRGDYFYDAYFERLAVSRIDRYVNFTWGTGRLIPRGQDYISIRWTGALSVNQSGNYRFKVQADDYARLWVDNVLLCDDWLTTSTNETNRFYNFSNYIYLGDNRLHQIILEYRDVVGTAFAKLLWETSEGVVEIIPQENLFSLYEVDRSPVLVTITSNKTSADNTICTGEGLYNATALHESYFSFCPRDVYGNYRNDEDLFYLSTQLYGANLSIHGNASKYDGVGPEYIIPVIKFDPKTYCFNGSYTPQRAGTYKLDIYHYTYSGAPKQPLSDSPFYVTVATDKTSGPKSNIYGLPSPLYLEAGTCHDFSSVSRDNAQNLRLVGGDKFEVYMYRVDQFDTFNGIAIPIASIPTSRPSASPTDNSYHHLTDYYNNGTNKLYFNLNDSSPLSDALQEVVRDGIVTDHQNGNYTYRICPVISGLYEIHVLLMGDGVSNQPFQILQKLQSYKVPQGKGSYMGQYVDMSPYELVVSHSDANAMTSTAHGPGLVGAVIGVPISFMVTVRDAWDNILFDKFKPIKISVKLILSPNATINVWDYHNGSFNVEYIAQVSGNNSINVYVNGNQIKDSPFVVPVIDGKTSADYTYAIGNGLYNGVTGQVSYFEVFAYDLSGNRKTTTNDLYVFAINGTNNITGTMLPCPFPPDTDHPICSGGDVQSGGHYYGFFTPLYSGDITVRIYLQINSSDSRDDYRRGLSSLNNIELSHLKELSNSPFRALIKSSSIKAELTDVSGTLYDTIAGKDSFVFLQTRDYFTNKILIGGAIIEQAILGVAVQWGTIQPWDGFVQGYPNQYYYKGFYAGYPTYYGSITDHLDGTYVIKYNIPKAGGYVMRLSILENGLNVTYFNSTDLGYLYDNNQNKESFILSKLGIAKNLGSSISWTGDIGGYDDLRGGSTEQNTYNNKYYSRMESQVNLNLNDFTIAHEQNTSNQNNYPFYNFRQEYFSIRYTGTITPDYAEKYKLLIECDDHSEVRLYIGGIGVEFNQTYKGILVINYNSNNLSLSSKIGYYNFTNLIKQEFLLEYVHYSSIAKLQLYWQSISSSFSLIPSTAFSHSRNISHYNLTVMPTLLCSSCSTSFGRDRYNAIVGLKHSFLVYARDEFNNLLQFDPDFNEYSDFTGYIQSNYDDIIDPSVHVVRMFARNQHGVIFHGTVTNYGNSTYLVEYIPVEAGIYEMYVTIGCCVGDDNIGISNKIDKIQGLLIKNNPFILTVQSNAIVSSRSVVVGNGIVGGVAGEMLSFSVLYRDMYNNPTTIRNVGQSEGSNGELIVSIFTQFIDIFSNRIIIPKQFNIVYYDNNATIYYTIEQASQFKLFINMSINNNINNNNNPIIGSPHKIIIGPIFAISNHTVCRGLGMKQARINNTNSFEIQLYDMYHNHLIRGGNKFYIRLTGDTSFHQTRSSYHLDVVPSCIDTQNGRYQCHYTPIYKGYHKLIIKLLNTTRNYPGGNGLQGYYFTSLKAENYISSPFPLLLTQPDNSYYFTRIDPIISFNWMNGFIIPSHTHAQASHTQTGSSINQDPYVPLHSSGQSIKWDGYLISPRSDIFHISANVMNLHVKIFLDSKLIFDNNDNNSDGIATPMIAESAYHIEVIAMVTGSSPSVSRSIHLQWSTPTIAKHKIPTFFLYNTGEEITLSPFPVTVG